MKYALVLGGGGTRGAFEVGVWKAIREMGIGISAVCGTSIGAINGALFVSDADAETLWQTISAEDISPLKADNLMSLSSIARILKSGKGIDMSRLKSLLNLHIDEQKIRRSDILYGLCAYNNEEKKSTELFIEDIPNGLLTEYIAASACFPCFKPVVIGHNTFSDGGIQNNLPINMPINRGFDTVISVSVKGMGFVRDINKCGVNIIEINSSSPYVGLMDFDNDGIRKSITDGYISCLKAFGRLCGTDFAFETSSYRDAVSEYGVNFPSLLETAAKKLAIDPLKIYSIPSLIEIILGKYKTDRRTAHLVKIIQNNKNDFLHFSLDLLGKSFDTANIIAYLSNQFENKQKNMKKSEKGLVF